MRFGPLGGGGEGPGKKSEGVPYPVCVWSTAKPSDAAPLAGTTLMSIVGQSGSSQKSRH